MIMYVFLTLALVIPAFSFKYGGRAVQRHVTLISCSNSDESPIRQPVANDFNDGPLGTAIGGAQYDEFPMDPMDAYPTGMEDEKVLEQMRKERQISNDLWQSTLFRDEQCGEWAGSYELFELKRSEAGDLSLGCTDRGECQATMEAGEFSKQGVTISIKETYKSRIGPKEAALLPNTLSKLLLQPTKPMFQPTEFRTQEGNTIVGNAFTWGRVDPVYSGRKNEKWDPLDIIETSTDYPPDILVVELGIKDGVVRTRVRYAFTKLDDSSPALTQAERESEEYAMQLRGFVIIREAVEHASLHEMEPLVDPRAGPGIYDPQMEGEPYVQLNMPGRLSLLFPRGLPLNGRSVVTIECEGDNMRYQADRKFINLSGAIRTLELTEIRPADVESYPPPFVEVDLLK